MDKLSVRLIPLDEQVYLYAAHGKRAPVWRQYGIYEGDFLRKGRGRNMPRLFDSEEAALAALTKNGGR